MTAQTDVYAYFWIEGYTCSANEISARLQLTPTSIESVGDIRRNGIPAKFNSWKLLSPLDRGEGFLQEYLDSLLGLLEPRSKIIRELAAQYSAGINCVGYYYGSNPGLHLSAALFAHLAALQVPVDFDQYNYSGRGAA